MNQTVSIKQDEYGARFSCSVVRRLLPQDLLPNLTVLLQDSGYVTVSPRRLMRPDWLRINEKVRYMGGIWVSNSKYSHWSIPFTQITRAH